MVQLFLYFASSPSVPPFFRVPGGNAQWAAYLCCCVPTLYWAPLLSEATQHGAKGHAGMPIMRCGNCDCFWFKWFQMRLLEVHSQKQLVAVCYWYAQKECRCSAVGWICARSLQKHAAYPYVSCFVMQMRVLSRLSWYWFAGAHSQKL